MLGYGLLNSKIQEFCLSGIINSFLNRSTIYLYPIYLNYESATDKDKENIINSLYNIFIQEELRLSPRLFNTFQDFKSWEQKVEPKSTTLYYIDETTQNIVEVNYDENGLFTNNLIADKNYNNYPDLILKYILSSNVVSDKDYEFSKKLPNEIIEDGKNNLNKLFRKVFEQFYNSPYMNGGNLPKGETDYEAYYQSFKNYVTDIWLYDYSYIDFDSDSQNWWEVAGLSFTQALQDITEYLKETASKTNINKNKEDKNFQNQLSSLLGKLKYAINYAKQKPLNFVDLKGAGIPDYDLSNINLKTSGKEITPLDAKGLPINLQSGPEFFDESGDLQLTRELEYLYTILEFYYKKLTNQLSINTNIVSNIKQYIKISQDYGSDSVNNEGKVFLYDDEITTLKNISTYIEKYNGYTDSSSKIFNFYKDKKLLEDRDYYLKLLNGQINSLQTTKVDGNEKYLTLEG